METQSFIKTIHLLVQENLLYEEHLKSKMKFKLQPRVHCLKILQQRVFFYPQNSDSKDFKTKPKHWISIDFSQEMKKQEDQIA